MKCLILAGGSGERLWPLSRKNYPKQFIQIQKNHSIFQETIARNIPFCDEFIIVTNWNYRDIVENQMQSFRDITYQCVYEEIGRKNTAAILLSILRMAESELVLVVPADQLAEGEGYKDCIMKAKEYAREGFLVTFGVQEKIEDTRFGYIRVKDDNAEEFLEKPDKELLKTYIDAPDCLINSGMLVFRNDVMINEVRTYSPEILSDCREAANRIKTRKGDSFFSKKVLETVPGVAIEKTVLERSRKVKVVPVTFFWKDIGSLEDLTATQMNLGSSSNQICWNSKNSTIMNLVSSKAVVVNGLDDVIVVNTEDATYVGRYGCSDDLKEIQHASPQLQTYFDNGNRWFRPWGYYELLCDEPKYRVKKAVMLPGKTMYSHKHMHREEQWTIVQGKAKITLDGNTQEYTVTDTIVVKAGVVHQISNTGNDNMIFIETSQGEMVVEKDMISQQVEDVSESDLGFAIDEAVKLSPAFKDYLWGGTKLRDVYGKQCDLDKIAESWELSAHPAGLSIVSTGKHKGMVFTEYLQTIGKKRWGWKCQPLNEFPILVKFIDAKDNLSIQVHPDDEYALEKEDGYGKNEVWYIMDCEQGAGIYCGFKQEVTREEVRERILNQTILEVLNWIPVKKGDVYFIKAGTVHAIGKGIMICEIQQSSNLTYRLYDYDRRDKFGKPRELHLEKALDVMNYKKYSSQSEENDEVQKYDGNQVKVLARCKYFESIDYKITESLSLMKSEESFMSIICVSGKGDISAKGCELNFKAGDSVFLPAGNEQVTLTGECEVIVSRI